MCRQVCLLVLSFSLLITLPVCLGYTLLMRAKWAPAAIRCADVPSAAYVKQTNLKQGELDVSLSSEIGVMEILA